MRSLGLPVKRHFICGLMESWYVFCQNNFGLNEKSVLLESNHGSELGGDIFYLLKELSHNFQSYRLYLSYGESLIPVKENEGNEGNDSSYTKVKFKALLRQYQIENVELVRIKSAKYWLMLATCKYLINDDSFHPAFTKRDGQVYLNTWHGTPLKKLGLEDKSYGYTFGNVQRNLLASDYLMCPSKYMTEIMVRAFRLKNLFPGQLVNEGAPRNIAFFNVQRFSTLKEELDVIGQQVIVYMPVINNAFDKIIKQTLTALDKLLGDEQILFVKLSPTYSGFGNFNHIRKIPDNYETYDFLNIADCLVTDYSPVMFDFACSRKQIVLFIPDETEPLDTELYVSIDKLPFVKTKTVSELVEAINGGNGRGYYGDSLIEGIIKRENGNAARNICRLLLCGESSCLTNSLENNKKENVLIFVDGLPKNGITSSALNLINIIDLEKRNYLVAFKESTVEPNKNRLYELPTNVGITSIGTIDRTLSEYLATLLYYKLNLNTHFVNKLIDGCYRRNFKKYYGNLNIDCFIQFPGYGRDMLQIFLPGKRKIVFVHNNMKKEVFEKKNQHKNTLVKCYQRYDTVVGISKEVTAIAKEIGGNKGNYVVIHNAFDYKAIQKKSLDPIIFDSDTECFINTSTRLLNVLDDKKFLKFITIGRFSREKGHFRLIDAFETYWTSNNDCFLIIIGGYGTLFPETVNYAKSKKCQQNIIIIKSISNPMPILKRCDLFILSSTYEGLGLVLFEADCLGIPAISTNITGPREIFKQYKGTLVDDSTEGLLSGMRLFSEGEINRLNIDFKAHNQQVIAEFEAVL